MTTTFTFGKNNNYSNNSFLGNTNSTNYSKILDDIILADIINKNDYLFKTKKESADILLNATKKPSIFDDEFIKASKFLTNYKKYKKTYNIPYILGKMYTLSDGTPIVFYDDEIQIGFDTYSYSDFNSPLFLKGLNKSTKKIIINIFTTGTANININLL